LALGHEGHHVECNETAVNAMKADIQAMGGKSHIHRAMEATEK
jgi:hypothetical protein